TSPRIMEEFMGKVLDLEDQTENSYQVEIELGDNSGPPIIELSPELAKALRSNLEQRNTRYINMASGAGHDAVAFAEIGIPTIMIFVRNQDGSHNPDEGMRVEDFEAACGAMMDLIDSRRKSTSPIST